MSAFATLAPRLAARRIARAWVVASWLIAASVATAGPTLSRDGPDAAAYGQAAGFPAPPTGMAADAISQQHYVGLHSRYDRYRALRSVPTSPRTSPLKRQVPELELTYESNGRTSSITDYLRAHPLTGLLIAKDDTILFEHYQYARTDTDRLLSHSMAKTITGLLVGAALEDGAIRSIDDPVSAYVPELVGTEYGATPIRALLLMASGIAFSEEHRPGDGVSKLVHALLGPSAPGAIAAVRQFGTRAAEPGTLFNYSSADSEVLGLVVSRATRTPLADYFSQRLWAPLGAEADAAWDIDPTGQEMGFCCVVARLRDWARLGLMIAHDGQWNGQQVVSRQWIYETTTPNRSVNAGYGYQIWLSNDPRRHYQLRGLLGQFILIDPATRLVLVQTAVRTRTSDSGADAELQALWSALLARYGLR